MEREVTGARRADAGLAGHRWGRGLLGMRWRGGKGDAAAPEGVPTEVSHAECGSERSAPDALAWGHPPARVPTHSRFLFLFLRSREAVAAPPVGEGKRGCVGKGRSDADAKVAASGHHFCARKQNPDFKAAAAWCTQCLAFRRI